MLAITLARENQINNYQPQQNDDSHFELKVINDGLFPEIRVCFINPQKEKNESRESVEK